MRRVTFITIVGWVFLFGGAASSAQVKRVQMHIDDKWRVVCTRTMNSSHGGYEPKN